jgi:hypothetical protein
MYSWVSMEFRRNGIPPRHGIPPSRRNSPLDTEFRQHGIPPTRNSACFFYFHIFNILCYAIYFLPTLMEFRGIPRNLADFQSLSVQYV